MKILSVDDKVESLYLLEAMIRGAGSGDEVVSAYNGEEALQKLDQEKFDAIISDVLMPQMDGFEFCHRVKQREDLRHIPFIFYTATYTEKKDMELGLRLGASRFLIKPVDPNLFLATLREVVEECKAGRAASALPAAEQEEVTQKAYNQRLVRKLDHKVEQLEQMAQMLHAALEQKGCEVIERQKAEEEVRRLNTHLEDQVRQRTAELDAANRALRELVGELEHFSYTITHDMRAPLRAMQSFADLMAESCASCQKQEPKEFLRRIGASAKRMDLLIADALSYSKTVRQQLPIRPLDADALLRGILESYPELQPSKAQIQIEGQIPPVMGNEAGLTQCFSNLLGNAVKFVRPGQRPEIHIRAEPRESWVRVWIEDNGIGISKSMLPRLFEMFSRGNNSYEGTGIGLALVRKVIDRMGGKVGVQSEEGKGSQFWLDLKLAVPSSEQSARKSG